MTRNKLRLAIVGAGPAGIYAADILLKAERHFDVSIDLFDHLPAPYGLVRYGVAPDHPRIKGIITALREVLDRGDIRTTLSATGTLNAVGTVKVSSQLSGQIAEVLVDFNDRVTEIFKPGKYVSPRSSFVSLALPSQGIGAWAGHVNATAEIDDAGLRRASAENAGRTSVTANPDRIAAAATPARTILRPLAENMLSRVRIPILPKLLLMSGRRALFQLRSHAS